MLSEAARPIIEASVPLLRAHGETITQTFYKRMFAAHPELANLFNLGNQANSAQQQSLASAVYAYAANFQNPAALGPAVSRIAHKHAAVGVTPAQYMIVGKHLLEAIAEVLGDMATPEVLAAWGEAYWRLAVELIALEARIYEQAHVQAGEFLKARVVSRHEENAFTTTFVLASATDIPLPTFLPGQYISLAQQTTHPTTGESIRQLRQFSLSNAPGHEWRLSVKRELGQNGSPDGRISNQICDTLQVGATVDVSAPFGDFVLQPGNAPVVLISGGIGITPVMSMWESIQRSQPQRQVKFLHACRSGAHQAYGEQLRAARQADPTSVMVAFETPGQEDVQGRDYDRAGKLDLQQLSAGWLPPQAHYYLCGPLAFMQAQRLALLSLGVDASHVHYEVFRPDLVGSMSQTVEADGPLAMAS